MIRQIEYQGFRNLADGALEFAEDFNFIIGENGAGKTNLLEMIYYAGTASSFRVREERRLIRFDCNFLRLDAVSDEKNGTVYLDSHRKKLTLQGNEVHRVADFVGWFGVTILSLDDIWIVRGSPGRRRFFLDWAIAKVSPSYLNNLIAYRKVIKQRNKVLQTFGENGNARVLDVLDEQLVKYGNAIYKGREDKLVMLRKYYNEIAKKLGLKSFDFFYRSSTGQMRIDRAQLAGVHKQEISLGQSLLGPHRDDLYFTVNGKAMQHYASEGEERMAAISLKLAAAEMYYKIKNERSVLLLDEVGAELDTGKKRLLLELLNGQVFYASTQLPHLDNLDQKLKVRILRIKGGAIEISSTH